MSRLSLEINCSLAGLAEGWTDDHFLTFKVFDSSADTEASAELSKLERDDHVGLSAAFRKYIKKQFVRGKVLIDGKTVDAEEGDVDDLPNVIIASIYEQISRSKFADPKAGKS